MQLAQREQLSAERVFDRQLKRQGIDARCKVEHRTKRRRHGYAVHQPDVGCYQVLGAVNDDARVSGIATMRDRHVHLAGGGAVECPQSPASGVRRTAARPEGCGQRALAEGLRDRGDAEDARENARPALGANAPVNRATTHFVVDGLAEGENAVSRCGEAFETGDGRIGHSGIKAQGCDTSVRTLYRIPPMRWNPLPRVGPPRAAKRWAEGGQELGHRGRPRGGPRAGKSWAAKGGQGLGPPRVAKGWPIACAGRRRVMGNRRHQRPSIR